MTVLVDTSALFALLDEGDENHRAASLWFGEARQSGETLVTHNYVMVEAAALVHRRLGPESVRACLEDLLRVMDVVWVDEGLHRSAVSALLAASRRRPSLVDWVSFEFMRNPGIDRVFAFDRDFEVQGFQTV